jgi:hypothetical protein
VLLGLRSRRRRFRGSWVQGGLSETQHTAIKARAENAMRIHDAEQRDVRSVNNAVNNLSLAQNLVFGGVKDFEKTEELVWRRQIPDILRRILEGMSNIPEAGTLQRKPRRMRDEHR